MERFRSVLLSNKTAHQTMFKNIFWLTISRISGLLRFVVIFYAARILDSEGYGLFSYILGIVGLLSIFADLGLSPLLIRDTARRDTSANEYFATSFWLKSILVGITCIIFYFLAPYFVNIKGAMELIPIALFLIIFDNFRDFIIAYLRGLEKMELETLIVTVLNFTLIILGFIILKWSPSVKSFFIIYTLASGVALLLAIYLSRHVLSALFRNFRSDFLSETFHNAWPIALSGTFGIILLNTDIFMLGIWSTAPEIGIYTVGQKIIQALYLVPTLLASGVFPTIASIINRGDRVTERNFNEKSMRAILLFTLPLVVGGMILAKPIFLLFGHGYAGGEGAFMFLLLNALFMFPAIMLANLVLARNLQRIVFKYVILGAVLNVILNFLLIPKIGIVGAALAALISQMLNYLLTLREVKKINNFRVLPYIKKLVLAAMLMGLLSFGFNMLGMHVLINIALSAAAYFVLLFVLREEILSHLGDFLSSATRKDTPQVNM